MRKTFLLIISLIIAIGIFAQKDKKATEILDRVIAKTESYKTMEVEFTLAMDNVDADIHDNKNGVLLVMGDKYKLTLSEQNHVDSLTR